MRLPQITLGDITTFDVDAIVNAANETLLGGGGVDGAIHAAAGPRLLEECRGLGGCRPGEAKVTPGYGLIAPWIIHTVGPRWRGGSSGEEETLRRCYRSVFAVARQRGFRSVAFPSISTGAFRYPLAAAARAAIEEILRALSENPSLTVTVVCFGADVLRAYQAALEQAAP
jgi:O-acetyl-ADP-ribose deacetylase (regulator of RNase III)